MNQPESPQSVEQRLTNIESRLAALDSLMTQFIEEQRAYHAGERERQERNREHDPASRKAQEERRTGKRERHWDSGRRYAGLTRLEKRIDKMCFGLITSDSDRAFYIRLAIMMAWGTVIGWHIGSAL